MKDRKSKAKFMSAQKGIGTKNQGDFGYHLSKQTRRGQAKERGVPGRYQE